MLILQEISQKDSQLQATASNVAKVLCIKSYIANVLLINHAKSDSYTYKIGPATLYVLDLSSSTYILHVHLILTEYSTIALL